MAPSVPRAACSCAPSTLTLSMITGKDSPAIATCAVIPSRSSCGRERMVSPPRGPARRRRPRRCRPRRADEAAARADLRDGVAPDVRLVRRQHLQLQQEPVGGVGGDAAEVDLPHEPDLLPREPHLAPGRMPRASLVAA
jgi:hypothetical protein